MLLPTIFNSPPWIFFTCAFESIMFFGGFFFRYTSNEDNCHCWNTVPVTFYVFLLFVVLQPQGVKNRNVITAHTHTHTVNKTAVSEGVFRGLSEGLKFTKLLSVHVVTVCVKECILRFASYCRNVPLCLS